MEKKHKIEITSQEDIQLLEFLFKNIQGKSKNNIKSILKRGSVLIDGKAVTKFDYMLHPSDKVTIIINKISDNQNDVEILYEDSDFLVINKPVGLLTVAANDTSEKTAFKVVSEHARKNNLGKLHVVHRLDKETSGVLIFTKTEKLKEALQENWNEYVTKRGYVALVEGTIKEDGRIVTLLAETKTKVMYTTNDASIGKEAITNYKVVRYNNKYTLLNINIETGRKNQIRIHLKEMGHPIVGDKKYESSVNPLKRLGLHANILEIKNPLNNKIYKFEAKTPIEFHELVTKRR